MPAQILEAAARGAYESEVWCTRQDGSALLASILITAVRDDGRPARIHAGRRDITEQMRIAEERMQSQKLEVIGRLAGSVAHDFNNLLTIVSGFTELLQQSLEADETHHMYLDEITKAADQAASLTQQLLAFGRRQLLQRRDRRERDRPQHGDDAAAAGLGANARDAMPTGGMISITTGNVREAVGCRGRRRHRRLVTLVVSDTGQGMDAETLARIFEPFFTTKEVGKGSGLGLATVDGIVAQSGGRIRVASEPNEGTTFTILLPATAGSAARHPGRRAAASPTGSETVLLVEDEPALRRLESAGAGPVRVHGAGGAERRGGAALAEAYHGPINLVLTDVVMPRMSGRDLASAS